MPELPRSSQANGSITTHYSEAELGQLIGEAKQNYATDTWGQRSPLLRRKSTMKKVPTKVTRMKKANAANIGLSH